MLGAGGFGAVLLAREDATEQQVACKVVNLRSKKMKSPHEMLTKEVKILMNLNHVSKLLYLAGSKADLI